MAAKAKAPSIEPRIFSSAGEFRAWLERHHAGTAELLVLIYKSHARESGLTYFDALDEALCFGWIDGVRRRIDDDRFSIRFSPRRQDSIWSAVNIRRVTVLESEGRMHGAGIAAFRARSERRSRVYSYESRPRTLSREFLARFRRNARAWKFFSAQAPWYRRTCSFWVMSAKQEATRKRRIARLIESSAIGKPIAPLKTAKIRSSPRRPE